VKQYERDNDEDDHDDEQHRRPAATAVGRRIVLRQAAIRILCG
jgi:hypothetical protein